MSKLTMSRKKAEQEEDVTKKYEDDGKLLEVPLKIVKEEDLKIVKPSDCVIC